MSNNVYSGADFQCDQTEGYPTVLCWDFEDETAWLEPAPAYDDDSPEAAQCRELCEEWGTRTCDSWEDYNDLLESIGEEAYQNAAMLDEEDGFDMSMQ
jgi:predicted NUDIX family NTP pyrophosphohydrolase